ncbi:MAG: cupin domain-containing protein [Candidatus Latescibacterota bacterium]
MDVVDLRIPAGQPIAARPASGPGSPFPQAGFSVWLCRVEWREPVTLEPSSAAAEQILYVVEGIGSVQQASGSAVLEPHKVYRPFPSPSLTLQREGAAPLVLLCLSSEAEPLARGPQEAHLGEMAGTRFPARRWGRSISNGGSPIRTRGFTAGLSILEPGGGQVPWHHHPDGQREVYLFFGGRPQMCVGGEVGVLQPPAAVCIPGDRWHQLTNLDPARPLPMVYCYEGETAAPHWWQERDGVLPRAGEGTNPPLPAGAFPQCTLTDAEEWRGLAAALF